MHESAMIPSIDMVVGYIEATLRQDPIPDGQRKRLPRHLGSLCFSDSKAESFIKELLRRYPDLSSAAMALEIDPIDTFAVGDVAFVFSFESDDFISEIGHDEKPDFALEITAETSLLRVVFFQLDLDTRSLTSTLHFDVGSSGCCHGNDLEFMIGDLVEEGCLTWEVVDPYLRVVRHASGTMHLVICEDHDSNQSIMRRMSQWEADEDGNELLIPLLISQIKNVHSRVFDEDEEEVDDDSDGEEFRAILEHSIHHALARIEAADRSDLWRFYDQALLEFTKSAPDSTLIGVHLHELYGSARPAADADWLNKVWPSGASCDLDLELKSRHVEWFQTMPDGFDCGEVDTRKLECEVASLLLKTHPNLRLVTGVTDPTRVFNMLTETMVHMRMNMVDATAAFTSLALIAKGWNHVQWAESRRDWTVGQLRVAATKV